MNAPRFIAPMGSQRRISSDSVWPLRTADGLTFAERKAKREAEQKAQEQ